MRELKINAIQKIRAFVAKHCNYISITLCTPNKKIKN